jgi:hypothetical protein
MDKQAITTFDDCNQSVGAVSTSPMNVAFSGSGHSPFGRNNVHSRLFAFRFSAVSVVVSSISTPNFEANRPIPLYNRLHSLRRHPQSAIEANDLSVQHRIVDNVQNKFGELLRPAEPRGKRDRSPETVLEGLWHAAH